MAGAESKGTSSSTREDRLKQALRANLRRRKMQAKQRKEPSDNQSGTAGDSAKNG